MGRAFLDPVFPYSYRAVPVWRNGQTRGIQNLVRGNSSVGFDSLHLHDLNSIIVLHLEATCGRYR